MPGKLACFPSQQLLGKEVIRQLRSKKHDNSPFELQESGRSSKGPGGMALLTNTVSQLAWEKDIDLTKGHAFVEDPDAISQSPHTPKSPLQLQNGSAGANQLKPPSNVPAPQMESKTQQSGVVTPVKKRKSLVYNRVSPLLSTLTPGEEFSDISDEHPVKLSKDLAADRDQFDYPSPIPEELEMTHHTDFKSQLREQTDGSPTRKVIFLEDPGHRIVQSEFSFSADSSSATEYRDAKSHKSKVRRRGRKSESTRGPDDPSTQDQTHKSSDSDSQRRAQSAGDIEVGGFSVSPDPSASCWIEETPSVKISSKRGHKKGKKKKSRSQEHSEDQTSVSSNLALMDSSEGKA